MTRVSPTVRALAQRIAELHGRRHCILTGRATSALTLAFRALSAEGGRIVFPAILCPQPANAALYAGFEPLFCDVSAADANLDPGALRRLLSEENDVVAVVFAHLYGEAADMKHLAEVCQDFGVVPIEDAAQAMGASLDGRPLGSFGEMSVLSFGRTKVLDVGDGGAVMTEDDRLAEKLADAAAKLPPRPAGMAGLQAEYRALYYRLKAMADENPRLNRLFLPLPEMYRNLYLYQFDPARADALSRGLDRLDEEVALRRRKAAIYAERLDQSNVRLLKRQPGGVPWRFNLLLPPERQTEITEGLRRAGFDASNWYPALPKWYATGREQDLGLFENAHQIERGVLNLWLDAATDEVRIRACCAALCESLERSRNSVNGKPAVALAGEAGR
ncbi:MAG: DegT/DnrJ/EryC1/StrS family aminotransferase [Kiloniellales bacterium]